MSTYIHFTEEQKQRAASVDLEEFLRCRGEKLLASGREKRLARDHEHLILVCGHYEGVDQRFIDECVDEEISMGDFVLTGGEIPAMALADCLCRMVPGVLPEESCYTDESHWDGLLEYPQYSRPEEWHGKKVPPVLMSGHHANIEKWRREQSILRTYERRPDLLEKSNLTEKEKKWLKDQIND